MRSPIRSASSVRQGVWAVLLFVGLLNLLWFVAIAPPPPTSGFERCLDASNRGLAVCEPLRPSWMTWEHPDLASYAAVRGCSVQDDPLALTRVGNVVRERGLDSVRNLEFLRMVRSLEGGVCAVPEGELRVVEREYEELTALEGVIWASRVQRATEAEASWIALRATWHEVGQRFLPLWMPLLLLGWISLLVALRRIHRYAEPIELDVGPAGVRLDGVVVPRASIACLSIEGRRLRIERWNGPPIYSRPLPPEALANADEICSAVGLWDDEPEPTERRRQRAKLERLVRVV